MGDYNPVKPKDALPYDMRVLLPQVKDIHDRFSKGLFDRITWNKIIDLYNRSPKTTRDKVRFDVLMDADNNKEMCILLFIQIKHYLEKDGFLRDISNVKTGEL